MKQKHPTLPRFIIKLNSRWYLNTKTQRKIPVAKLGDYVPIDEELKHELIINKRYDLRQD